MIYKIQTKPTIDRLRPHGPKTPTHKRLIGGKRPPSFSSVHTPGCVTCQHWDNTDRFLTSLTHGDMGFHKGLGQFIHVQVVGPYLKNGT